MSTFKGDTPPKRLARLETWFSVEEAMGKKRFKTGQYLVLAGPEAGDVSVALGLGVPAKNITACDLSAQAVMSARLRFPEAKFHHGDVLEMVDNAFAYDFIFLDFCCQLTDPTLNTIGLAVVEGLRRHVPSYLACGFLVGREQDIQGSMRSQVCAELERLEARVDRMPVDERPVWADWLPYMARTAILQQELLKRVRKHGCVPVPHTYLFYKSRGPGEVKGMPMCIYLAQIVRCSRQSVESEARKAFETHPAYFFFTEDNKELGQRAMKLSQQGYDPAYLFNVSKTTVAAWKAHATRGTY